MLKTEAIKLLGGTIRAASENSGITYRAIWGWPDVLPERIRDRVQAALYRQQLLKKKNAKKLAD